MIFLPRMLRVILVKLDSMIGSRGDLGGQSWSNYHHSRLYSIEHIWGLLAYRWMAYCLVSHPMGYTHTDQFV